MSIKKILAGILLMLQVQVWGQVKFAFSSGLEYNRGLCYFFKGERIARNKSDHSFYYLNDRIYGGIGFLYAYRFGLDFQFSESDFGHKISLLSIDEGGAQRTIQYSRLKYLDIGFSPVYYLPLKKFTLAGKFYFLCSNLIINSIHRDETEFTPEKLSRHWLLKTGMGAEIGEFFGDNWWGFNFSIFAPEMGAQNFKYGSINFSSKNIHYAPLVYINRISVSLGVSYKYVVHRVEKEKTQRR